MRSVRLETLNLTRSGDGETLLRTGMGFHLWHIETFQAAKIGNKTVFYPPNAAIFFA